jgi:hypothetical protein
MIQGVEPEGRDSRYWVTFFMTRMASRDLGLRTAISELCVHSNHRYYTVYSALKNVLFDMGREVEVYQWFVPYHPYNTLCRAGL